MGQSSSTQSSSTAPWSVQQPYLESAFGNAQNAYNTNTAEGAYSGNYVAPTNSNEYSAANDIFNFGTGTGSTANDNLLNAGSSALNTSGSDTSQASDLLGNLFGNNTTGNLTNQANQIASGYNVPAEVAAAMQPAEQAASESTLPNLYDQASVTGNLNNSRTALAQGVVQQGLGEQAQALGSELANQNYTTGLTDAQNLTNQNTNLASILGNLGTSLGFVGTNATGTGVGNGINLGNSAETGAQTTQNLDQSNLNNSIDQYTNQQQFPWTQLSDLMGIIGGNYGSQSSSTTTNNPSLLSSISSGIGILGNLF